jgi:hypothetical protein
LAIASDVTPRAQVLLSTHCSQQTASTDTLIVSLATGKWVRANYSTASPNCAIDLSAVTDLSTQVRLRRLAIGDWRLAIWRSGDLAI